jgi:hypothetical protein
MKKIVKTTISGGKLIISFPRTASGQAVISAIAIASREKNGKAASSQSLVYNLASKTCKLETWLNEGDKQYSDDSISFRLLPPNLYGADWLQFSKANSDDTTSFDLAEDADVFIGMETSNTNLPSWLHDYENTKTEIETDENGGKKYLVYRKRFSKGATVRLNVDNDIVLMLPVTNMQPAYDLIPVNSYDVAAAKIGKGAYREQVGSREALVVKTNEQVTIEWNIQTGIAGIYSITLKYFLTFERTIQSKVQLTGSGNALMLDEPVNFIFTKAGKWNTVTFNTKTMINAGNYVLRLIVNNGDSLAISGIDVQ